MVSRYGIKMSPMHVTLTAGVNPTAVYRRGTNRYKNYTACTRGVVFSCNVNLKLMLIYKGYDP